MRNRVSRRMALVFAVVLSLSLVLVIPATANLWLHAGDSAQVLYTDGDGVNVRAAPGFAAGIMTTLPEGFPLEIVDGPVTLEDGTSWYEIATGTGADIVSGWVSADYLDLVASAFEFDIPDESDDAASGVPLQVNTGGIDLNLRSAPTLDSNVFASIPNGAWVEILAPSMTDADGNRWSHVRYGSDVGYSASLYLGDVTFGASTADAVGTAIVREALNHLGVPYLWAGTTPVGFDCSGYTYYVLNRVLGGGFARPMEDQVVSGVYVEQTELIPGDLVFFQNTYQWGISHVGFYMGDGMFINAGAEFDAVGISNLNDPYWQSRYLTARRVR